VAAIIVGSRAHVARAGPGENGIAFSLGSHASDLVLWEQPPGELLKTLMRLCLRVPVSSKGSLKTLQSSDGPRIVNQSLDWLPPGPACLLNKRSAQRYSKASKVSMIQRAA
jgi:hypothetical protein